MTKSDSERCTQGGAWDSIWTRTRTAPTIPLEEDTLENAIDRAKLEFLKPDLPDSGRALEIGCGSARLVQRLANHAPLSAFGVDLSPQALALARETAARFGRGLSLAGGDALRLPFCGGSFDVVLSGGLLEHFRDPRPVLVEMTRVLRPGGLFYADVVPRRFSLYRLRELPRILWSPWLAPGVYESSFGPAHYRGWLTDLGCDRIRIRRCGVYPPCGANRVRRLTHALDGTPVATLLGWYFMIAARKR